MPLGPNSVCRTTIDGHNATVRLTKKMLYLPFWECETKTGERLLIEETKLMQDDTPYRYKEAKFARYAATIGAALRAYPDIVEVNPGRVSPDTFVAQYREAITAKQRYHYSHPLIDDAKFTNLAEEIRHAIVLGSRVLVGPREALRRGKQTSTGTVVPFTEAKQEIEFRGPIAKLEQLCEQISNKWFEPPVTFFVRNLDTQTIESLSDRYDVMIVPDASDATKFLIM